MKKIILTLSLVVFLFGFVGCEKSPVKNGGDEVLGGEEKYPVEVPFEMYLTKEEISCQFKIPYTDSLVVINSTEELENYIVCTGDSYPEIDFSKSTLLVTRGLTPSAVEHVDIEIMQNTVNEYTMSITVYTFLTTSPGGWTESVIVPKIDDGAKITLNAVIYDGK